MEHPLLPQQQFGSSRIDLPFTEIAQDLHSSREVVSPRMRKLAERGAIRLMGSHVEVVNLD
jgi:CRP/FNR family transcriptional regulator